MSIEIDEQVIQNTQKCLEKYIKKPPLTEKLLRKPPFRFLHDIINNLIRETGFLKGLYSERELVSENVKNKEDKIAFLNKLIDATKSVTGVELAVRPSKVIAGFEPTETNLLLQAIGTAIDNNLDSTQYVADLKTKKKSKIHNALEKDKTKTKEKGISKDKTKIPVSKNQSLKPGKALSTIDSKESIKSDKSKPKSNRKEIQETPKLVNNQELKKGLKESPKNNKSKKRIKEEFQNTPTSINNIEVTEDLNNLPKQKDQNQNETQELSTDALTNNQVTENKQKQTLTEVELSTEQEIKDDKVTDQILASNKTLNRLKSAKSNKSNSNTVDELKSQETPTILNLESNNRSETPVLKTKNQEAFSSTVENHIDTHLSRPRSSLRPPTVRPSSARPGAPRLRNEIILPEGEAVPFGKVNVILENFTNKENDEEETVTIQTAPEVEYQPQILQMPTDKGHLVEQILEQINHDVDVGYSKPTLNIEWEQDALRDRNNTNKEIEQLKAAIQTLTRVANPLGKLINYLHEDIEAMQSEMDMWTNSSRQIMAEVGNQKRITDESNKPLQMKLEEIEENIVKHKQIIISTNGNILRNEERIRNLLMQ